MLLRNKKIPCYVLVFDQVDIIKQSLNFLASFADKLDIIVVENPSPNSPAIGRIIDELGKAGKIRRHYLMSENITSTAYTVAINQELERVRKSRFVVITDGDIIVKNGDWLKEEVDILKKHRDVFACGVTLDKSNLPIKAFPEAKDWIPQDDNVHPDYFEVRTGGHLLLMRGAEFGAFMDRLNEDKLHFVDGDMHWFCYDVLHKKWARTRNVEGYHLTWDLYHDKDHPYTKLKTSVSFQDTWRHDRTASYKLTEY